MKAVDGIMYYASISLTVLAGILFMTEPSILGAAVTVVGIPTTYIWWKLYRSEP